MSPGRAARTPPSSEQLKASQHAAEMHERRELVAASGVPARYREARLTSRPPSRNDATAWGRVARALGRLIERPGVVALVGLRGAGKTWLGCGLVNEACRRGVPARYASMPSLLVDVKASWGSGAGGERSTLEALIRPRVLVLDEVSQRAGGDWDDRLLTSIVDRRYAEQLSTVLISNTAEEKLRETLGDSIYDRLEDDAGGVIACSWSSLRGMSATDATA